MHRLTPQKLRPQRKATASCGALAIAMVVSIAAQTPKPAFEVASIKPNNSGTFGTQIMMGPGTGGRFIAKNITARQLVVLAYRMQEFQVTGGASWITSERFDIEAKPEAGKVPTPEESQLLLQSLLEDRFQLKVRKESKDGPAYALVVAKAGSKLKLSADQSQPSPGPPPPPPAGGKGPGPGPGPGGGPMPRGAMRMGPGMLSATAVPLSQFLRPLSDQLRRTVVDKTGLTGLFDIELHWTPDQMPANLPPDFPLPRPDPNGPSIFTAVQEQLGLRLESATAPVESLVIERLEKPSEN